MARQSEHDKIEQRERYRELMEEHRTIIPGAQVLFAFLLTVPFASRFAEVDRLAKIVFTVSLLSVAAATVVFLAPAAYHRLADGTTRDMRVRFGVRMTLTGLALLALSITCAVFVVVRFVFGMLTALGLAGVTGAFAFSLWFMYPRWLASALESDSGVSAARAAPPSDDRDESRPPEL